MLDIDKVIAVTSDGRKLEATVMGIDPNLEVAILETKQVQPEHFDLSKARDAEVGERVLALSNLFGIAAGREMASLQKGVVMARTRWMRGVALLHPSIKPNLCDRRHDQ